MENTLEQQVQHYFMQLSQEEKKSVLHLLKTIVNGKGENQEKISIEEYNKEIDEAETEFEKGEYISHEEMLKQIKQW